MLTNEMGIQWGTEPRSNLVCWSEKGFRSIQDIAKAGGGDWKTFAEQQKLHRCPTAPPIYDKIVRSIPWILPSHNPIKVGQWVASKEDNGTIQSIFHISRLTPLEATLYHKDPTERIHCVEQYSLVPRVQLGEVRIIRCGGPKRNVIDYNPQRTQKTLK